MPRKKSKKKPEPTVGGILGVGLDAEDGHKRVTQTDEMVLVGGSEATHERMQETAIRFGGSGWYDGTPRSSSRSLTTSRELC